MSTSARVAKNVARRRPRRNRSMVTAAASETSTLAKLEADRAAEVAAFEAKSGEARAELARTREQLDHLRVEAAQVFMAGEAASSALCEARDRIDTFEGVLAGLGTLADVAEYRAMERFVAEAPTHIERLAAQVAHLEGRET